MGVISNVVFDVPEGYFKDIAEEVLMNDEDYWPFVLSVDSDHASYVEFGSQGRTSKPTSKNRTSKMYSNIEAWLKARGGDSDPGTVIRVMKKIIRDGSPPQPFVRPAVLQLQAGLEEGEYEGFTMRQLSEELIVLMTRFLVENNTLYGDEDILHSISVEPVSPDVVKSMSDDPMVGDLPIDESIWKEPDADWKGDTSRTRMRRESNLRFRS